MSYQLYTPDGPHHLIKSHYRFKNTEPIVVISDLPFSIDLTLMSTTIYVTPS